MDIGIFVAVEPTSRSAGEEYHRILDVAQLCEELGFASIWLASRHFSPGYAALPSPLLVLAAAAALTERLILGTSVISLPFEDPIRLAEDFSTLDAVSDGRGRLGLGSGDDPLAFRLANRDFDSRQAVTSEMLPTLLSLLEGDLPLFPAIEVARSKVALGAQSARGAAWAGSLGVGLLQGRSEPKTLNPTMSQARAAEAYRRVHPTGRVSTARNVWIGDANDADLAAGIRRHDEYLRSRGREPLPADLGSAIQKMNILVGSTEQIARLLPAEISAIKPDELLITPDPGGLPASELERRLRGLSKAFGLTG